MIDIPGRGRASHLVVAHFVDSWRDADGERAPGTPVGWVLPTGEPLARYEVGFADGSVRLQQEAAELNIALSNAGPSFNNSFNESSVLGNLPAVQNLCDEALRLDQPGGHSRVPQQTRSPVGNCPSSPPSRSHERIIPSIVDGAVA